MDSTSGVKTARKSPLRSQIQNSARTDAQPRRSFSALRSTLSALRFCLSDIPTTLRIIRVEVRSCCDRTGAGCDKGKSESGRSYPVIALGPMYEETPDGHFQHCRETLSRIEGIEEISAKYPWAGAGDVMPFLAGWQAAMRYARRNGDTLHRDKVQSLP